jgi:predicted GIY-YIG superfamily endonuclease
MGAAPDYQRLASEVLGIRNAPADLARKLVSQALVVEDRRDAWQRIGERVCAEAPQTPGVYILRDEAGRAVYVGKSTNIRRRLRAHFARRHWRRLKADFARAVDAEWVEVGSEIEALLREAMLIEELLPIVNVHIGPPALDARAIPASLVRDVILVVPSIEEGAVELVAARAEGRWMMQRTRRNGADLIAHTTRVWRFFHSRLGARAPQSRLAPLVFSWLAGRGAGATRLDPHDFSSSSALRSRFSTLFADEGLFTERIVVR